MENIRICILKKNKTGVSLINVLSPRLWFRATGTYEDKRTGPHNVFRIVRENQDYTHPNHQQSIFVSF